MPTVVSTSSNMVNALAVIKAAMRVLNILASGETPEPEEANDFLEVLNGMINAWQIERLMIFTIQRQVFTPAILKQVYTVGPGGDFNIARPPKLPRVGVIILTNPQQPLELPMDMLTDVGWEGIPVKNILSSIPLKCWDDQAYPLRNLSMWPVPDTNIQFALYTWMAIQEFSNLYTKFAFPPGYVAAMKYNLAVRIASEFGIPAPPPTVSALAVSTKENIQINNGLPIDLRCDEALVRPGKGYYDWRSDQPVGGNR